MPYGAGRQIKIGTNRGNGSTKERNPVVNLLYDKTSVLLDNKEHNLFALLSMCIVQTSDRNYI